MADENQTRVLPRSEADYNLILTDTLWGGNYIHPALKDRLSKDYATLNKNGELIVKKENLWGILNFYTRDIRLANLDPAETKYVRYYLDLANDYLVNNFVECFVICISRAANVLETSQSKKGFLRKRQNTLTTESYGDTEARKKTMFGASGGARE